MLQSKFATVTLALALVGPAVAPSANAASLKVATSAGAYGQAQKIAVFDPFAKDTGTSIEATPPVGGAGNPGSDWDVADLAPNK